MFVDMVGFSGMTSTFTRKQIIDLIDKFTQLIKSNAAKYNGEIIKSMGDGFIVTFLSPTNAVLCGLKIQSDLEGDNLLSSKIAINSGEVTFKDGDIFGEPINIAARLEATAEAGEVYFTEAVYLAMNKHEAPSSEVDARLLKGIPEEIKVYKVIKDQHEVKKARISRKSQVLALAGLPKDKINIISRGANQSSLVGVFSKGFGIGGVMALIGVMSLVVVGLNSKNTEQVLSSETKSPVVVGTPTPQSMTSPSPEPQPSSSTPTSSAASSPSPSSEPTTTPAVEEFVKNDSGKFLGIIKNLLEK
ncbi:MAG: Serine/threonine-protein kinase Pkn2 [Candidatus Woesebacteria bacterium GW2011_GWA1_39_11b]|nr:MAG: Serine/threonine-protein kinase Pkn2 [Candidatus Woesebacteria bacterium GW2011_GWA1_39_11b]